MTNRELALKFINCFCTGDIDGLEALLAPDLQFSGPLHSFYSAADYLASLRADPPQPCEYTLLSLTEDDDRVAVFYEYLKPGGAITIAQHFGISQQQISDTRLVFDSAALS